MLTDRNSMGRFADCRCEESFAVFVRRHGAMVMDVCCHYRLSLYQLVGGAKSFGSLIIPSSHPFRDGPADARPVAAVTPLFRNARR